MTFGFWLTAVLSPHERFGSDEQTVEIDLGPLIGQVTLRGSPAASSIRESGEVFFIGRGHETYEQAECAGRALKDVVRLAAVTVHRGLDVGQETVRGRAGPVVIERAARDGLQLLPDVHGLQVFEEIGTPAVLSGRAEGRVITPLDRFTEALHAQAEHWVAVTDSRALACDLFAQSRFESSRESRFLMLVTALEVLSERRERSGVAARLVEDFRAAVKQAMRDADDVQRKQLDSLLGSARDLRCESIGAAIRELTEAVPASGLIGDTGPVDLAGACAAS